jgi:hypothetical protein
MRVVLLTLCEKRVLRSAYPMNDESFTGSPRRSAQNDTEIVGDLALVRGLWFAVVLPGWSSCFPTHRAMRLRDGWGTEVRAGDASLRSKFLAALGMTREEIHEKDWLLRLRRQRVVR